MDALNIALPPEIGICKRQFQGKSRETLFLIATGTGHSPVEERAVLDVLEYLHGVNPIEWLFETLDGSWKSGDIFIDQREADVRAYRSFQDAERHAAITDYLVRQGNVSAAKGFAMRCEPAVHLQPFDDWYGWALYRDALYWMNGLAGRMESICSLLEAVVPQGGPEQKVWARMAALMRLAWTSTEYSVRKPELPVDPEGLLTHVKAPADALASAKDFLTRFQFRACESYDSSLARIETLVRKALDALRRAGATRGAMVLGAAWIDTAIDLLIARDVGFLAIWPPKVSMSPMLDHVPAALDEYKGSRRAIKEVFLGERVQSAVEALDSEPAERLRERARDWAAAAQSLLFNHQLDKGEECAKRALEIDPSWADAWTSRGIVARERRDHRQAVDFFERAIALEPRNSRFWGLKGEDLDSLGRHPEARKALVRAIRLDPASGAAWSRLGVHLYHNGPRREACYCFERGKTYGDDVAADNWRIACHFSVTPRDCPREVRPWRLAFRQALANVRARLRRWSRRIELS